ncbi:PREDICTED: T-cell immunoglobulin and mucin domain-containing protein 4 isoform X2 [Chinchilla lanigera]|uniref:T-cell immunoglobulin and mucin domain-containing protein 4 isoform X2 n=1 Tax=Chinchilla lanigera TaxID=34839 RepID=UPI000695B680|nr:PREDICTED: T-cell immunoglobulin and mucin domain-containing protein 4 isoform X2 [Chinchilla lanigera]
MSKGAVVLWLAVVLEWLCLAPTRSELTQTAFLGQSVTLPCLYSSWSPSSNSMCWGRGECPNSKCNEELIHTDGTKVTSRMSGRYRLWGNIQRGDVSLTILNTQEGDSGVYCCRIEVPGWFNDVKRNIQLVLRRAPTTTRQTTTSHQTTTPDLLTTTAVLPTAGITTATSNPTTSPHMATTAAVLPTTLETTTTSHPTTTPHMATTAAVLPSTFVAARELTARTPLQTKATSVFTTTAAMCPQTRPSSGPEIAPEPSMEGPISGTESGTFLLSSDSLRSTEATSADSSLLTSEGSKAWVRSSAPHMTRKVRKAESLEKETETEAVTEETETQIDTNLLIIIASGLGLTLLALLGAVLLQGKVMKANCLKKHKRLADPLYQPASSLCSLHNLGESKSVLSDTSREQEDEDGLFTL